MMRTALEAFYRCPEEFVNYTVAGDLSTKSGFFRFGEDTVCYGRSCCDAPATVADGLPDLSRHVSVGGTTLQLPFDPDQVIEGLRRERYISNARELFANEATRKIYYFLRPLLLLPIRKHIQRAYHRGWEGLRFPTWPVDTTVEQIQETLLRLLMKAQGL